MTQPSAGQRTERRHKLALRLLGGLLVAAVLGMAAAYRLKRRERAEKHLPDLKNLPSNIDQQLSGYSFTRSDNGKRIFTVHAARTIAFKQGGTTVLEDVSVEIFGQSGDRHDLLKTQRCEYDPRLGGLFAPGRVEIELNVPASQLERAAAQDQPRQERQPFFLETSRVRFTRPASLLVTDQPVEFRIGLATGTARGLEYATQAGWIDLKNDVNVQVVLERMKDSSPIQLSARSARFEKRSGVVTLDGPLEIVQEEKRVTAPKGRVLLDSHNRVRRVELEEGVQWAAASHEAMTQGSAERARAEFEPRESQLRSLLAERDVHVVSRRVGRVLGLASQELRIAFSGNPARPESGDAFGNVRFMAENAPLPSRGAPSPGLQAAGQELTASEVQFDFRGGTWALRGASTVGPGKLTLIPDGPKVGRRIITANPFLMSFNALGKLKTLRGRSRPTIVFEPPPASPDTLPAESSSDRLEATLNPATEELQSMEQTGQFRYQQGDRQASAQRALYQAQDDLLKLSGNPRIWDDETRTRADHILVNMRANESEGVGHVQSTHLKDSGQAPGEPVNVVADRMQADEKSHLTHYEGHVRVWQGSDVLESSSLDVLKNQRRISSGSQVISSFLQPAAHLADGGLPANPRQNETQPVTIRADHLEYFEDGRKASYQGNVRLETENTTLQADRMDVYFSASSVAGASEVERAVGDGRVTVTQPGRRASGQHAEYFAAADRMELTGGPPTLYDVDKGFTTGQRLTFFLRDDRIFLDGGEKFPTFSRHQIPQ